MNFICVDHHLNASNHYQTRHGHKQEQEMGWRHVKMCLNHWYVFFYYIIFLSAYTFFYRFYKHFFTRQPSPQHVQPIPNRAQARAGAGKGLRHVKMCLNCWYVFFLISFFYLLITFFTGSTNVFLRVDHHLNTSNRFQTEHRHEQGQERA